MCATTNVYGAVISSGSRLMLRGTLMLTVISMWTISIDRVGESISAPSPFFLVRKKRKKREKKKKKGFSSRWGEATFDIYTCTHVVSNLLFVLWRSNLPFLGILRIMPSDNIRCSVTVHFYVTQVCVPARCTSCVMCKQGGTTTSLV